MRKMLPSLTELSILATFAVLAGVIFASVPEPGRMMPLIVFPLVLVAALMGANRTGQLSAARGAVPTAAAQADKAEPSA